MKKAKVVWINYEPSDCIPYQGTREEIKEFLAMGYYVKKSKNGYWLLLKNAKVNVLLENQDGQVAKFNIKSDIVNFYNKSVISQNLVNKFIKECEEEKICFYLEDGRYCFERV